MTKMSKNVLMDVAQLDALVSFFASCSPLGIALGLIGRIALSDTAVGPKQNRFTVRTAVNGEQQIGEHNRTQWTPKYRITIH